MERPRTGCELAQPTVVPTVVPRGPKQQRHMTGFAAAPLGSSTRPQQPPCTGPELRQDWAGVHAEASAECRLPMTAEALKRKQAQACPGELQASSLRAAAVPAGGSARQAGL